MASLYIDTVWHRHSQYTYKSITGTLTATYSGNRLNVSFSGSTFSNYEMDGGGYPATGNKDTIRILIDGSSVASTSVPMFSSDGNVSCSGYADVSSTPHTVTLTIQCGDNVSCPYGYYADPCHLGSIDMESPYTPISTFTLNSVSPSIGIANETTYTANYTISGGTNDLTRCIY